MHAEWFSEWFDSPWYHLLYRDHNDREARAFLDHLVAWLNPAPDARILDLACGRGRHALYLSEKGFDVTGLDISANNVRFARRMEQATLSFFQHDMRQPFRVNYFDLIFNFFTSFGYFDRESEHLQTLRHIATGLRPGGRFVLDFLNPIRIREQLVPEEVREVDGMRFIIRRHADDQYIHKEIRFEAEGQDHCYRERVRAYSREDLEGMLCRVGLQVTTCFGDYHLQPFDPHQSGRLILVAEKPAQN
jgi:SAM-dependent methyltransferase